MRVLKSHPGVFIGKGEETMFTMSDILVALANLPADTSSNSAAIVVVVVVIMVIFAAASSGTSPKKLMKQYYCPHCKRPVTVIAKPTRSVQKLSVSRERQGKTPHPVSQPRVRVLRANAPLQLREGKLYCPYCKKEVVRN